MNRTRKDSGKYDIGNKFLLKCGEEVTIVDSKYRYYTDRNGHIDRCYFKVMFKNGAIVETNRESLRTGRMKNPFKPSLYGVGYSGVGEYNIKNSRKEYRLWYGIFVRVYSKGKDEKNCYYGCTINERWHNFQNFCEDVRQLENYEKWKKSSTKSEYALDKDIRVKGNREYSKDKCMFVLTSINSRYSSITGKIYLATRLSDGYTEKFACQTDFSNKYNLTCVSISKCLGGKLSKHKGWTFKVLREGSAVELQEKMLPKM